MLEQQRIEYLQAMGIQLWMPRQPLAHAAESLWLAGDESPANAQEVAGVKFRGGHAADLLADMNLTAPSNSTANASVNNNSAQNSSSQNNDTQNNVAQKNSSELPSSRVAQAPESLLSDTQAVSSAKQEDSQALAIDEQPASSDLTIPEFELYFALWPCGILWVASSPFDQQDHIFQTSVSYSLLFSFVPQASYSQFKWPYIKGGNEDQSTAVALRALTAQWDYMSGQGARAWVAVDNSSLEWLSKVAVKPLYSVDEKDELYSLVGKKQLWNALKTLPNITVS